MPPTREDTRFIQIRNLLRKDLQSKARATQLYRLIDPICRDDAPRADFIDVARWSVSHSTVDNQLPTVLAIDTIEHVAMVCSRTAPDAAFDVLKRAKSILPEQPRLDVISARLLAASGELARAEASANAAKNAGSVHAIALTANIQARRARAAQVGYVPGMLDKALKTVSVEPAGHWQLIDLTAVLSTQARLLSERAFWEAPEAAQRSRLVAAGIYARLAVAPFISASRRRALDRLCFAAVIARQDVYGACKRAAQEMGNLGGAHMSLKPPLDPARFEVKRYERMINWAESTRNMRPGSVVLWVTRGDELELLEWADAAVHLLSWIQQKSPRWVWVDRTQAPRAKAVVRRMFEMAGVEPAIRIDATRDTLVMPCVTAIVAGRRTPKQCPISEEKRGQLEGKNPYAFSVLVGRDLDAEIDDLRLYNLRTELLSFRQSRFESSLDGWFKGLSDVLVVTTPANLFDLNKQTGAVGKQP